MKYQDDADELELYAENDEYIYRSRIVPSVLNMQRRIKKGTYDHSKCPKLWRHVADAAAKQYKDEFGGHLMSVAARKIFAQSMADNYYAEIQAQGGVMFDET